MDGSPNLQTCISAIECCRFWADLKTQFPISNLWFSVPKYQQFGACLTLKRNFQSLNCDFQSIFYRQFGCLLLIHIDQPAPSGCVRTISQNICRLWISHTFVSLSQEAIINGIFLHIWNWTNSDISDQIIATLGTHNHWFWPCKKLLVFFKF